MSDVPIQDVSFATLDPAELKAKAIRLLRDRSVRHKLLLPRSVTDFQMPAAYTKVPALYEQ
jgi:hypothetical protein